MTIESLSGLIANLGVPVALLIGTFWLLNKEREDHKNEVDALRKEFAEDRDQMVTALNNNTNAIQRLTDHIGGVNNDRS